MRINIKNITIRDLIALITVTGGLLLIARGIDGTVGTILLVFVLYTTAETPIMLKTYESIVKGHVIEPIQVYGWIKAIGKEAWILKQL